VELGDRCGNVRFGINGDRPRALVERKLVVRLQDDMVRSRKLGVTCTRKSREQQLSPLGVAPPASCRCHDAATYEPRSRRDIGRQTAGNAEAYDRARALVYGVLECCCKTLRIDGADERSYAVSCGDPRFEGKTGNGDDGVGRNLRTIHMPKRTRDSPDLASARQRASAHNGKYFA